MSVCGVEVCIYERVWGGGVSGWVGGWGMCGCVGYV